MKRPIRKRVHNPHPPERVWNALTSSEALAARLMPNDFKPQVGHRFSFRMDPAPGFDGILHCEELELENPVEWCGLGGAVRSKQR